MRCCRTCFAPCMQPPDSKVQQSNSEIEHPSSLPSPFATRISLDPSPPERATQSKLSERPSSSWGWLTRWRSSSLKSFGPKPDDPPQEQPREQPQQPLDSASSAREDSAKPASAVKGTPPAPAAHKSGVPSLSEFEGWYDTPLLLRPRALPGFHVEHLDSGRCRLNHRPIPFESELFKGWAVIDVLGLPSSPEGLFKGKRRRTSLTFQGRFKQPLSMEAVVSGQEFFRPAQNLPAKWLVDTVLIQLARSINPSLRIGPMTKPCVLAPLLAAAQEANVCEARNAPDPSKPVPEDLRLLGPSMADAQGNPISASARMRYFRQEANRRKHKFSCDLVWTFSLYQHVIDMGRYELNMFRRFELASRLDGQPLQFMVKDQATEQYLFNFEAWHTSLLPAAERHAHE